MEAPGARWSLADRDGKPVESAEGTVLADGEGLTLLPAAGGPAHFAWTEIEGLTGGDATIVVGLRAGRHLELSRLAKRKDALASEILALRRASLADVFGVDEQAPAEEERGEVDGVAATFRLQPTSVAILPDLGWPWLLPYGAIGSLEFDETRWTLVAKTGPGKEVAFAKLGKRTDAFRRELAARREALLARSSRALAALFPELGAPALRGLGEVLRDGVPASSVAVDAAAPGAWELLVRRAPCDDAHAAALAELAARAQAAFVVAKELPRGQASRGEGPDPEGGGAGPFALLFVFAIGRRLVLEAPGEEGRATYLFALEGDPSAAAAELLAQLVSVGFRREAIHLDDAALDRPEHARWRAAAVHVPGIVALRRRFRGRAAHGEAWKSQLDASLGEG